MYLPEVFCSLSVAPLQSQGSVILLSSSLGSDLDIRNDPSVTNDVDENPCQNVRSSSNEVSGSA